MNKAAACVALWSAVFGVATVAARAEDRELPSAVSFTGHLPGVIVTVTDPMAASCVPPDRVGRAGAGQAARTGGPVRAA